MKCSICGKEITQTQIKYGDANPVKRDASGKITERAFHHQCVIDSFENDRHAIQQAEDEREGEELAKNIVAAEISHGNQVNAKYQNLYGAK